MRLLPFFLSIFLTISLAAQEKFDLNIKYSKGDKFHIETQTEQTITQNVAENNALKTEQKHRSLYEVVVSDIDTNGNYSLKYTYLESGVTIKAPNGAVSVDYDSKKHGTENVPLAAKGVSALIGKTFYVTMNKKMQITEVKGMDEIISQMIENVGSNIPLANKKQMLEQFKKAFGNEATKTNLQIIINSLPSEPISINETWKSNMTVANLFTFSINSTNKLTKVEKGIAKITSEAEVSTLIEKSNIELRGIKITPELKGKQNAEIDFDLKMGQTVKSVITQNIDGHITTGPNKFPMKIDSKIINTVKKITK